MSEQPLRDVILIQADFLNTQAEMFDKMATNGEARLVLDQRLKTAAQHCRDRARALNDVLELSQRTEAKAP